MEEKIICKDIITQNFDKTEQLQKIVESILENNINKSILWCGQYNISIHNFYTGGENKILDNYEFIHYYFPFEKNVDLKDIQITQEGTYSVTYPKFAEIISNHIKDHIFPSKASNLTITDATANVGGNTINFAKYFKKVNAVEISEINFKALKNNIKVYNRDNVTLYHNNYLDIINKLKNDVVFLDPPWGGPKYKLHKYVTLYLDNIPVEKIISKLYNKVKLVALKVPSNINIDDYYKESKFKNINIHVMYNRNGDEKFKLLILE